MVLSSETTANSAVCPHTSHHPIARAKNRSSGDAIRTNEDVFMTPKEEAELLFKHEFGGRSPIPEYEQRARIERTKTAQLRMQRLAHEAALVPSSPRRTSQLRAKKAAGIMT